MRDLHFPRLQITLTHDALASLSATDRWSHVAPSATIEASMYSDGRTGSTLRILVVSLRDARGDLYRVKRCVGRAWDEVEHVAMCWLMGGYEGWLSEMRAMQEVAA